MVVTAVIFSQNHLKLEMGMDWSYYSDQGRFLEIELHVMSLIVPEMVDSVALSDVEVLLLPI